MKEIGRRSFLKRMGMLAGFTIVSPKILEELRKEISKTKIISEEGTIQTGVNLFIKGERSWEKIPVGEVTEISLPAPSYIDITTLDSTVDEYMLGRSTNEIEIHYLFNASDKGQKLLRKKMDGSEEVEFKMVLPSMIFEFKGHIVHMSVGNGIEKMVEGKAVVKIDGEVRSYGC